MANLSETAYRSTHTAESVRRLEEQARQVARQWASTPVDVEMPGIRGWEIARRFNMIGDPGDSGLWRKFWTVAVLSTDGRLHNMIEVRDIESRLVREAFAVTLMGPEQYEEWDARYAIVDEDNNVERYTRADDFEHPFAGGLTAALRRSDDPSVQAAATRELRRRVGSGTWELAKVAVPTALGAPLVYFLLLGTWSERFMKPLVWNSQYPVSSEDAGLDAFIVQFILVTCMIVCLAIIGLAFPFSTGEEVVSNPMFCGIVLGAVVFLYQVFNGSSGIYSWLWPPLFAVVGHLAYGMYRKTKYAT
ncbi:hypothetical protein [Nocardia salmonicida]|uniref:hypothetical protein n=1 Tax=Nocardia salmonicida TaxID=53431 RepID=UPI00362A3147